MKFEKIKLLSIALLTIALNSCEEELVDTNDLNKVVVEGYLFAGQRVRDIRLSETLDFDDDPDTRKPISDADLRIETEGKTYSLTADTEKPGFYSYMGDDLIIKTGQEYKLAFTYFEKDISSSVTVPLPPDDFRLIGSNTIVYDPKEDNSNNNTEVKIKWENQDKNYFSYVTKNIEEDPVKATTGGSSLGLLLGLGFQMEGPVQTDSMTVTPYALTHYGRHDVILYRLNQEYINLYKSEEQDSRNLNEPPTNITNGLGIFTAFNSDTLRVVFRKE